MNFSIIAVNSQSIRRTKPLSLREHFNLRIGDTIAYKNAGNVPKRVSQVDDNSFRYSANRKILSGMPIFDHNWTLQGMHVQSLSSNANVAIRTDAIVEQLHSFKKIVPHVDVNRILHNYKPDVRKLLKLSNKTGIENYLYWMVWMSQNISRFDIVAGRWEHLEIKNADDVERGEWVFRWGSRLVQLPDETLLIVGGVGLETSSTTNEVYQYYLETGNIYRKRDMIEKREAPCILYHDGFAYVMGGKFAYAL